MVHICSFSLGQLASVAGIDKSDFPPLGRPQLSSTIGPHPDGSASLTAKEFVDVHKRTDTMSSVRSLICQSHCVTPCTVLVLCLHVNMSVSIV